MGKLDLPRALRSVVFAQSLERRIEGSPQLCLEELRGRLSEFSTQGGGCAQLGGALAVGGADRRSSGVPWIDLGASFFPPDVAPSWGLIWRLCRWSMRQQESRRWGRLGGC